MRLDSHSGEGGGYVKTILARLLLTVALVVFLPRVAGAYWELPDALPPDEFGNILINRISAGKGVKAVSFSHWVHRRKHTCRVCHFELEFNMQANSTEITDASIRAGRHCGAAGCHDGTTVFGNDTPNCGKCHNGDRGYGKEKFTALAKFPTSLFGNRINWVAAEKRGLISPVKYLTIKPSEDVVVVPPLTLEAAWNNIPSAVFPHKAHAAWLDCNNCHPDIFNIKKKTTKHFSMERILQREFCGVCHMTVAFPMSDCKRCHPDKRVRE